MKMNKIIIPAAMLAVGVALVGSISSTLAWYQYSTKAQAAFIGLVPKVLGDIENSAQRLSEFGRNNDAALIIDILMILSVEHLLSPPFCLDFGPMRSTLHHFPPK